MGMANGHDDLLFVTARCPRVGLKEDSPLSCRDQNNRWAQPCPRTRGRPIRHDQYSGEMDSGAAGLGGRRKEILLALDWLGEPLEQQLQILAAIYEIDLRGVDHQQVTRRV